MKVFLSHSPADIPENTGIGRVVHAQYKYLPEYGIEFVNRYQDADICAGHTHLNGSPRLDVLHNHGLYWNGDERYSSWPNAMNATLIPEIRRAGHITVPSKWVAMPFRRDMHIYPTVIPHGINLAEWHKSDNQGCVLWNKSRIDPVCDPTPALSLALAGHEVVSTFAPKDGLIPEKMHIIGMLQHESMRQIIMGADVYLATAQETFGIGTLEAMASGVPILGYDWGGTSDLVKHKENGYLVTPGNLDALVEGLSYVRQHRARLSDAAIETAKQYDWPEVIGQYADLYGKVAQEARQEESGVAVIITCYNYASSVGNAIESALAQTVPCEVIVVNDGSTDSSLEAIQQYAGRVRIINQDNAGLPAARNAGIRAADAEFICCLDADDMYDPAYIATCLPVIQADRSIGAVYTGMKVVNPDGSEHVSTWPPDFDWHIFAVRKTPPPSCVTVSAMFRKEMWERAGGYKSIYPTAEDVEFWLRSFSTGYTAIKVTSEPLFIKTNHEGSMSRTIPYVPIDTWLPWMKSRQFPMATPARDAPIVRSYSQPLVTAIVIDPSVTSTSINVLDKLNGQSYVNWHAIAVNADLPQSYIWCDNVDSLGSALDNVKTPFVWILQDNADIKPGSLIGLLSFYSDGITAILAGCGYIFGSTEHVKNLEGIKELMGCSCGSADNPVMQAKDAARAFAIPFDRPTNGTIKAMPRFPAPPPGFNKMQFTGAQQGAISFIGRQTKRKYIGGNNDLERFADIAIEDVPFLESTGVWRKVAMPAEQIILRYTGNQPIQHFPNRERTNPQAFTTGNAPMYDSALRVEPDDAKYLLEEFPESFEELRV